MSPLSPVNKVTNEKKIPVPSCNTLVIATVKNKRSNLAITDLSSFQLDHFQVFNTNATRKQLHKNLSDIRIFDTRIAS